MLRALLAAAVLCLAVPAWAQGIAGVPVNGSGQVPTADPNAAAFSRATLLTPSGAAPAVNSTSTSAGTVDGSGGAALTAANAGYSFAWSCTGNGTGTVTLAGNGRVLPFSFFAGGGHDAYAIVDYSPGTATGCQVWNLR